MGKTYIKGTNIPRGTIERTNKPKRDKKLSAKRERRKARMECR